MVEAYWVGNVLLDRVSPRLLGASLTERFRGRVGRRWDRLVEPVPAGARPHHNFHVFAVYPWLGLLREGVVEQPLHVLDRCRIRWGRVVAVAGDRVAVSSQPLVWDGGRLGLGPERLEWATAAVDGTGFVPNLRPADYVALHWDWVCDRLSPRNTRPCVAGRPRRWRWSTGWRTRRRRRCSPERPAGLSRYCGRCRAGPSSSS